MKKLFSATAISAIALILSACSGSPQTVSQPATASDSAGSSTQATATPSQSSQPTKAATPTPAATGTAVRPVGPASPAPNSTGQVKSGAEPSAKSLKDLGLNTRGNLAQKVGETSVFGAPTGQQFADLRADSIQTSFQCTGPDAKPSINGQYVAIKISVTASPNFADSGWPSLALSNLEFTAWDASGVMLEDPIGNSAGCVPATDLIASPIEPGTKATGLVILDVPAGAGSGAFVVGGFEGSYGWEWHW